MPRNVNKKVFAELEANSSSVDQRNGKYIKGGLTPILLTIVAPNMRALELLATIKSAFVNYIEAARNTLTTCKQDAYLLSEIDRHHHGRKKRRNAKVRYVAETTYNEPYVDYWDGECKVTGHDHAHHKEQEV